MVQGRSTRVELAHSHHVARYCRHRHLSPDGRPLRDAFLISPGEEYLSTSFAVLNVGTVATACKNGLNLDVKIIALGESHDPSHTSIFGYTAEDTDTAAVLAKLAREVYPVT